MFRISDAAGLQIPANFDLEILDAQLSLVLHSAGGVGSSGVPRNAGYVEGLETALRRLADLDAMIDDAYLDSRDTTDLPLVDRRLHLQQHPYPIRLQDVADVDELRVSITNAQRTVGRDPSASSTGGNNRKRIRLRLTVPGFDPTPESVIRLEQTLTGKSLPHPSSAEFATFGRPGAPIIEAVARTILWDCLVDDGSLLGGQVWTAGNLAELHTAYVDNPDTSKTTFYDKLRKQLADVSDGARQLFAELYILNVLPASDLTADYKLNHTADLLAPISPAVDIPESVRHAFDYGMVNGGQGFNSTRWSQLSLLVDFAAYFKKQDPDVRRTAAEDPLVMRQLVLDSPGRTEGSYRYLLLYLLHPRFFMPIINIDDRRKLRNGLAAPYLPDGTTEDLDVDLRQIDDAVIAEVGGPVDYYSDPWIYRWLKKDDGPGGKVGDPPSTESPYVLADITKDGCFHDQEQLEQILERWGDKKNLILQGPPGTGKTWLARRLAYALIGFRAQKEIRSVQFHPNTSYEDFVRGWRPSITEDNTGTLVLTDGPLIQHAEDARGSDLTHVLIIEEINRGNPAAAFGEMLTLIEESKRNEHDALALSYPRTDGELFFLPDNLYLLGTMNIADRSLALVDFALRRRFAFETLKPAFTPAWENYLSTRLPDDPTLVATIRDRILALNARISEDPALGPDFAIGHSFFTPTKPHQSGQEWFTGIIDSEIAPLLREYWFSNRDLAEKTIDELRK